MKKLFFLVLPIIVLSCKKSSDSIDKDAITLVDSILVTDYSKTITSNELSSLLYQFSADSLLGRETGELGQKKAVEFLASYYKSMGIPSPINDSVYFQTIPQSYFPDETKASENVLAFIEGSDYPEEVVIISAHLDHLGTDGNIIYNGADDDGSGNVALMEMAGAFKKAQEDGHSPKRSLLFIHLTAEEIGLYGSNFYIENPVFDIDKTVANLNIDMVGRVDDFHENNRNYIYLIGSDRLSNELHVLSEKVNSTYTHLNLDYKYNDRDDRNRYYYRSDHYNFAKLGIPVIFYFNGVHNDYHKPTDTPDKIDYSLLEKRTRLIFATAWQIANQELRLKLD